MRDVEVQQFERHQAPVLVLKLTIVRECTESEEARVIRERAGTEFDEKHLYFSALEP